MRLKVVECTSDFCNICSHVQRVFHVVSQMLFGVEYCSDNIRIG